MDTQTVAGRRARLPGALRRGPAEQAVEKPRQGSQRKAKTGEKAQFTGGK
ncbi:hypothetical protein [Pseudomonas piscis]|nr:hypothetical protein [Pseudomonas piscis]